MGDAGGGRGGVGLEMAWGPAAIGRLTMLEKPGGTKTWCGELDGCLREILKVADSLILQTGRLDQVHT